MLLIHILAATTSILFTTYTAFFPSLNKIRIAYFLTLPTYISGLTLALSKSIPLGKICLSGLAYTFGILTLLIFTKRKLSPAKFTN